MNSSLNCINLTTVKKYGSWSEKDAKYITKIWTLSCLYLYYKLFTFLSLLNILCIHAYILFTQFYHKIHHFLFYSISNHHYFVIFYEFVILLYQNTCNRRNSAKRQPLICQYSNKFKGNIQSIHWFKIFEFSIQYS